VVYFDDVQLYRSTGQVGLFREQRQQNANGDPRTMRARSDQRNSWRPTKRCLATSRPRRQRLAAALVRSLPNSYASRAFREIKPSSRKTYRAALEPLAKAHGHRTAKITHRQAANLIAEIGEKKPAMANLTKRVLHALYKFAVKRTGSTPTPSLALIRSRRYASHLDGGRAANIREALASGNAPAPRLCAIALHVNASATSRNEPVGRCGRGTARYPAKDRNRIAPAVRHRDSDGVVAYPREA